MQCKLLTFIAAVLLFIYPACKTSGASAYAWGYNDLGELGDGTITNRGAPIPVNGLSSGVSAVVGGGDTNFALQNGVLYSWGFNGDGELGDGSTAYSSNSPAPVTGMSGGITAFSAGSGQGLALKGGALYSWGFNYYGQVGDGTIINRSTPVPVIGMSSGVTAMAGGNGHSLAIKNGAVYAWGLNSNGQVGDNTLVQRDSPVAVSGLGSGVSAIAAGGNHSLAILGGAVYTWGDNGYGIYGARTIINILTPTAVSGLSGVTSIAAGDYYSLAVSGGKVYAWGDNQFGNLGDGSFSTHLTPEQIDPVDLHNIVQVAASDFTSYALASDGSIWAWGYDDYGNVGNGTTTLDVLSPQHVFAPPGFIFTSISSDPSGESEIATIAPVPEPAGLSLLAVGSLALLRRRRMALRR